MVRLMVNLTVLTQDGDHSEQIVKNWTKTLLTTAALEEGLFSTNQEEPWQDRLEIAMKILTTMD